MAYQSHTLDRPVLGLFMRKSVSNRDLSADGPPRKAI